MIPRIRPAMIDSHGKPGMAGSIIGVETELVDELNVVVGVLETVTVDIEVLTIVVDGVLVVTGTVEAVDIVLLVLVPDVIEDVVASEELEDVNVVEVEFVPPLYVGGTIGSKWKIPVRAPVKVVTPLLGCWPTAQPSVGFVVKTEYKARPLLTAMGIARLLQPAPLNHAVNAFAGDPVPSSPTAHPLPLPADVP
jgi:hypothetical protein